MLPVRSLVWLIYFFGPSNGSVVSVDRLSGMAKPLEEDSTQVLKGNIISVDAPKEMLTNVPSPSDGYNFPVKLRDAFGALRASHGVSFDCRVDPPFVGHVRPWLDLDTGNSYCKFYPYSPERLVSLVPRLESMRPDLSLSIYASLDGANHASGSASALFIGGFSIMDVDKSSMQLNLTLDSNRTSIIVLGNPDVEVHWNRKDLIAINLIHKENYGIGGLAQYEVQLLNAKKFKDKISITLPATGQREEIHVKCEPVEKSPSMTIIDLAICAIMLGLGLLSFYWVLKDRPWRSQQPRSTATSSSLAPSTPNRSSQNDIKDSSPRTPQPFVDYVRRTIDETPYYRREGRRINPQNTY